MSTTHKPTALIPVVHSHSTFGDLRVVQAADGPLFVAADIARVLDLRDAGDLVRNIKKEYRGTQIVRTPSGDQPVRVINTAGLFQAVMSSRKAQAEPFQKWVLEEVLPSIGKTGAYFDTHNRMGQTLGEATGGAIDLDRPATAGDYASLAALMGVLSGRVSDVNERLEQLTELARSNAAMQSVMAGREREMRRAFTTSLDKIVRVANAQRRQEQQDPNRPLDESDVERLKYLLSIGASAKEVARRLHRTHEVIHRFINANPELVLRALQQPLL